MASEEKYNLFELGQKIKRARDYLSEDIFHTVARQLVPDEGDYFPFLDEETQNLLRDNSEEIYEILSGMWGRDGCYLGTDAELSERLRVNEKEYISVLDQYVNNLEQLNNELVSAKRQRDIYAENIKVARNDVKKSQEKIEGLEEKVEGLEEEVNKYQKVLDEYDIKLDGDKITSGRRRRDSYIIQAKIKELGKEIGEELIALRGEDREKVRRTLVKEIIDTLESEIDTAITTDYTTADDSQEDSELNTDVVDYESEEGDDSWKEFTELSEYLETLYNQSEAKDKVEGSQENAERAQEKYDQIMEKLGVPLELPNAERRSEVFNIVPTEVLEMSVAEYEAQSELSGAPIPEKGEAPKTRIANTFKKHLEFLFDRGDEEDQLGAIASYFGMPTDSSIEGFYTNIPQDKLNGPAELIIREIAQVVDYEESIQNRNLPKRSRRGVKVVKRPRNGNEQNLYDPVYEIANPILNDNYADPEPAPELEPAETSVETVDRPGPEDIDRMSKKELKRLLGEDADSVKRAEGNGRPRVRDYRAALKHKLGYMN